ncbi:MAG: hypothetical protein NT047_01565 [Deltaproteobacteria bacterium]|nr:hypothetical protein [Deltaproteobacteria bacterium]
MTGLTISEGKESLGEERNFQRYPVEVLARVELLRSRRKDRFLFLWSFNLSASGIFFPEWKSLRIGKSIKVEFYLFFEDPDTALKNHDIVAVTVTGKVVRSNEFGTAVQFEKDYQVKTYNVSPSGISRRKDGESSMETIIYREILRHVEEKPRVET